MLLEGPEGKRRVPVCEFYTGPGRTVRHGPRSVPVSWCTGKQIEGWSGHYIKYGKRKAMEDCHPGLCGARKAEPG